MNNRVLVFWLAILFVFCGAMLFMFASGRWDRDLNHVVAQETGTPTAASTADDIEAAKAIEFELTNQQGEAFDSRSLHGKIWVGSLFFSSCPSTCRTQNMQVAKLQKEFADAGVEFVSITCDPDKDTPKTLAEYSRMFGAKPKSWHFLTGDFSIVEEVGGNKFGITVERQVHSDRLVLFDRDGRRVGAYRSTDGDQFQELVDQLRTLTGEKNEQPNS